MKPMNAKIENGDDSDDRTIKMLRDALSHLPGTDTTKEMTATHLDSIRDSLDSRGDAFARSDLIVFTPRDGDEIVLAADRLPLTIGSNSEKADQVVDRRGVSGVHCKLEMHGPFVRLLDWESKNHTYLNGVEISAEDLRDGDEVRLGVATFRISRR